MDMLFDRQRIHLPFELVGHICKFLDVRDACSARLVNRCFSAAAKPIITDTWDSPSLLSIRAELSESERSYVDTIIDPSDRPWRGRVDHPCTIWTWLTIPASVKLEDRETEIGSQFAQLVCAPGTTSARDTGDQRSYKDGRKAVSWGRICETPDLFCIISQWDCKHSWTLYRDSEEASKLREFLELISPSCSSSSWSEYAPMEPRQKRHPPLFNGYYEIRTVYFDTAITAHQISELKASKLLYRQHPVHRSIDHPGFSPWWWVPGLRSFRGKTTVAARFAIFWRSLGLEEHYKKTERRWDEQYESWSLVVDIFERELQGAGAVSSTSFHCNFVAGPWWN